MAKTDWTMYDTVKPEDMNQIGAEINAAETPAGAQAKANTALASAKTYTDQKVAAIPAPNYPVTSVNSKTGAVTLNAADVGAETPSGAQTKANTAESNAKVYTDTKFANYPPPTSIVTKVNNKTGEVVLSATDVGAETPTGAQTKADAAKNAAIDWAKSFGLGSTASNYTGDLNTLDQTGFYYANSAATNKPPSAANGYVINIKLDVDHRVQLYIPNNKTEVYQRNKSAGNWTSWVQLETTTGAQAKATAAETAAKAYTDTRIGHIPAAPVSSVNGKTGAVTVTKSDVGLNNLDNAKQATKTEFDAHVTKATGAHAASAISATGGVTVQHEIDYLKSSVSDGKSKVAAAITDKGVPTAADAPFHSMADNIEAIVTDPSGDATAVAADLLAGKTAYSKKQKITGTMPDRGSIVHELLSPDEVFTIEEGYHDGYGSVSASYMSTPMMYFMTPQLIDLIGEWGNLTKYKGKYYMSNGSLNATPQTMLIVCDDIRNPVWSYVDVSDYMSATNVYATHLFKHDDRLVMVLATKSDGNPASRTIHLLSTTNGISFYWTNKSFVLIPRTGGLNVVGAGHFYMQGNLHILFDKCACYIKSGSANLGATSYYDLSNSSWTSNRVHPTTSPSWYVSGQAIYADGMGIVPTVNDGATLRGICHKSTGAAASFGYQANQPIPLSASMGYYSTSACLQIEGKRRFYVFEAQPSSTAPNVTFTENGTGYTRQPFPGESNTKNGIIFSQRGRLYFLGNRTTSSRISKWGIGFNMVAGTNKYNSDIFLSNMINSCAAFPSHDIDEGIFFCEVISPDRTNFYASYEKY